MKKIVTNNEFDKICKDAADNLWKKIFALRSEGLEVSELEKCKKEIWKEYDNYLDSFEIIPFNINTDNEMLKKVINAYCREEEQKEFKTLYRGFTNNQEFIYTLKNQFNMDTLVDDYYNVSLFNDDLKLMIEYTEGDLNFSISDTLENYNNEKQRTIEFYSNN